jgi:hypothetical protein
MNWNSWNSLPPDIQDIIIGATGLHWSRFLGVIYDRFNLKSLEVLEEYDRKVGNPDIHWLNDAEREKWEEVISPRVDEWVQDMESKGLPGKAALEDVKGWLEQYKRLYN